MDGSSVRFTLLKCRVVGVHRERRGVQVHPCVHRQSLNNYGHIDPTHVAEVLHGLFYETALAGSRNSLLPTLEVTTIDHILFGTDWPAAPESTVVRNIANLTSFDGVTAEDLQRVERDNALRLFPRFA